VLTDKENAETRACVTSAIAMAAMPDSEGDLLSVVIMDRRKRTQSMG
jgi:hypothetical protein